MPVTEGDWTFNEDGDLDVGSSEDVVLGPGDHALEDVQVNGRLEIVGPARVVLDDFVLRGGGQLHVDASNGEVEIYVTGMFSLASRSDVSTDASEASQVRVNLLAEHSHEWDSTPQVAFNSNANFVGVVYAPRAHVVIDSNFEFFGALAAHWVQLRSNSQFHFDESLLSPDEAGSSKVEILSWRSLSQQQVDVLRARDGILHEKSLELGD